MPCNYNDYPPNWKQIRHRILVRAGDCCEECGIVNHTRRRSDKPNRHGIYQFSYVVLTIAHLDHDKENWEVTDDRLKALCQRCHLKYDLPRHIANRKYGRNHNGRHQYKLL
ncbi:hypothetical protein ACRQ5D_10760 [Mucilaginibacter sp. P25]|uniref:hypothetical protein n=1 Tax=Mucilaginibacter sp. P25 TaxID=3423945 RepID=UPI003D7B40E5